MEKELSLIKKDIVLQSQPKTKTDYGRVYNKYSFISTIVEYFNDGIPLDVDENLVPYDYCSKYLLHLKELQQKNKDELLF